MTTKANAAAAAVPLASGVSYFPFGPMTAAQLGNGINEAWSYDLDQRLTQISAGSVLNRTFAYTLRNQIASDGTANYLYDAVGRLTLDQPIGGAATTYSYDANGNRLTRARPAVIDVLTYQPFTNQLNQVVSTQTAGSTTRAISRDARGATTADTSMFSTMSWRGSDMWFSRYGAMASPPTYQRLDVQARANHLGQRMMDYRRITTDIPSNTYTDTTQDAYYDRDGNVIDEFEFQPRALVRQYVYLNGQPLSVLDASNTYWYVNDQLGTPQRVTNAAQQVVWQSGHDAFGDAAPIVAGAQNPLRFPGQRADRHVPSLFDNWNRSYDASLGRYTQSDPIGLAGGINTYQYANANPLSYTDPLVRIPLIVDTHSILIVDAVPA